MVLVISLPRGRFSWILRVRWLVLFRLFELDLAILYFGGLVLWLLLVLVILHLD